MLVAFICGLAITQTSYVFAQSQPQLDSARARARYWSYVDSIPRTRAGLLARYGPPMATAGDTIRNDITPSVLDSIVAFRYQQFEAQYYVPRGADGFLATIIVTIRRADLPLPVGVGSRRADLVRVFGQPTRIQSGPPGAELLAFDVSGETTESIQFQLQTGRVVIVYWLLDID